MNTRKLIEELAIVELDRRVEFGCCGGGGGDGGGDGPPRGGCETGGECLEQQQ
jgi:hypothetical protein